MESSTLLRLTSATTPQSTGVSAWSATPIRLKYGFKSKFTFNIASGALGFAFVIQSESNFARGGSSSNLGYTFTKSVAVEFDTKRDASDDPNDNHVEVHTRYASSNSAGLNARVAGTYVTPPALASGTNRIAIVEYNPISSSIKVTVDSTVVAQVTLDVASLNSIFNDGNAYFGFTSSTSDVRNSVSITDWSVETVPLSTSLSVPVERSWSSSTGGSVVAAGTQAAGRTFQFQLKDSCGNSFTTLSQEVATATVVAELLNPGGTALAASTAVTDNRDGKWSVTFWNSAAGSYTLRLTVSYGGASQPQSHPVTVVAAAPTAANSVVGTVPTAFVAGVAQTFTVTAKDVFGNTYTKGDAAFNARFACCEDFSYTSHSNGVYTFTAMTTSATPSTTLEVKLSGTALGNPYTVSVAAGDIDNTQSYLTGAGLNRVTAGVPATIQLNLRDRYGNVKDDAAPSASAYKLHLYPATGSADAPVSGGTVTWVPRSGPTSGYLQYSYNIQTSGDYRLACWVNNAMSLCKDSSSVLVGIDPADLAPATSVVTMPTNVVVGNPVFIDVDPRDTFNNRRLKVNPGASSFALSLKGTVGGMEKTASITCSANAGTAIQGDYVKDLLCSFISSGVYRVTFHVTGAVTYTVDTVVGVTAVGTAKTFTALGAGASAALTTMTLPGGSVTSAQNFNIIHVAKDRFGNIAQGDASNSFTYSITKVGGGSFQAFTVVTPTALVDPATAQYQRTMKAFDSGNYVITGFIGGVALASTLPITVLPGAISPPKSTVTGTLNAAESTPVSITIQARDAQSNPLTATNLAASITASVKQGSLAAFAATVEAGTANSGQYLVKFTMPTYSAVNPTITLTVTYNGETFTGAALQGTILRSASNVFARVSGNGLPQGPQTAVTAGDVVEYQLQLTDSNGNNIAGSGDTLPFTLIVTNAAGQVADSPTLATANGKAKAIVTFTKIGVYTFQVYYGGQVTSVPTGTTSPIPSVTVNPGAYSPVQCVVSGVPTSMNVGASGTFSVTLYDSNGNLITGAAFPQQANYPIARFTRVTNGETLPFVNTVAANPATGLLTYTFTAVTSGSIYVGAVTSNDVALGSASNLLEVAPGKLASTSVITLPAPTVICYAGSACTATFMARDSYSNVVNYATASIPANFITLEVTGNTAAGSLIYSIARSASGTEGEYTITFTPKVTATAATITIKNSDGDLVKTSAAFRISPAFNLDLSKTVVSGLIDSFDVTSRLSWIISGRDSNNNPWFDDPTLYEITLANALDQRTLIPNAFKASVGPGTGQIRVSWTITTAGSYTWRVKARDVDFGVSGSSTVSGFVSIVIQPGVPSATATTFLSRLQFPNDVLNAGETKSVVLQTRDKFLNTRTTAHSTAQFTVAFFEGKFGCVNNEPVSVGGVSTNATGSISYTVVNLNDGRYRIELTSTKANSIDDYGVRRRYYYIISMGGVLIRACDTVSDSIQVVPGPTAPANTLITGISLQGVEVGTSIKMRLTFADSYNNPTGLSNNEVVTVGQPVPNTFPDAATHQQNFNNAKAACLASHATEIDDNSLIVVDAAAIVPGTGPEAGTTTATITAQTAKRSLLLVTVNGVIVNPGQCNVLKILPTYPDKWTTTSPTSLIAGRKATFTLNIKDKFDNVIMQSNLIPGAPVFSFTATLALASTTEENVNNAVNYIIPAASYVSGNNLAIDFNPVWPGTYDLRVQLVEPTRRPRSTVSYDTIITFTKSVCAARNPATPVLCADDSCVATLSACPEYQANCPFLCGPGTPTCKATAAECACPAGQKQCSNGRLGTFCIPNANECPISMFPVSLQPSSPASSRVCMSGQVLCPDHVTCAETAAACPVIATTCAAGEFQCPDGSCRKSADDCGTRITCREPTHFLCSDGTCVDNAEKCSRPQACRAPLSVRCGDGSCRAAFSDCPTTPTCRVGQIRCESGACVDSVSQCPTLPVCSALKKRCPDGTCVSDLAFCPTVSTCAPGYVQCSNGACVSTASQCNADIHTCPSSRPVRCPGGQCVATAVQCPSRITCPTDRSILCTDGTCVASKDACPAVQPCPSTNPYRCPADGTCVRSIELCPTMVTCPPYRPVKCEGSSCVAALSDCKATKAQLSCPASYVRCPGGACAPTTADCPTTFTCRKDQMRCPDGTCRANCNVVASSPAACPDGKVQCPESQSGVVCADNIGLCPSVRKCPRHRPVRCADASCASRTEDCPTVVTDSIPLTRVPCAGGFWASNAALCGTAVTCPPSSPVKCWDESCRVTDKDCPPERGCPSDKPFLCPDGSCQLSLWACSGTRCSDPANQVRCPAYSSNRGCVANNTACIDVFDLASSPQIKCPFGQRCWDGSCASELRLCPARSCPKHLPVLCDTGACAANASQCPLKNGCPFDLPIFCPDGLCAASTTACPSVASLTACEGGRVRCATDGSCRATQAECDTVGPFGCSTSTPVVCHDKSCAPNPTNLGSDTITACKDTSDAHNACPAQRPYRCPGGYCATSHTRCPVLPPRASDAICRHSQLMKDTNLPPMRAFCDDGSCAYSLDQCPTIVPCPKGQYRCGDGTCRQLNYDPERAVFRDDLQSDFNKYADHGAPCSGINTCPSDRPYRCQDGVCAGASWQCVSDYPVVLDNCCADGRSYSQPTEFSKYGTCSLTNTGCVPNKRDGNYNQGCPHNTERCTGGMCRPKHALAPSWLTCSTYDESLQLAGCPVAKPFKCPDGSCAADSNGCLLANGCSSTSPILCADGTCAATASACPASVDCPTGTFRCPDTTHCVSSLSQCKLPNGCPRSHPTRCALNGACARTPAAYYLSSAPTGADPLLRRSCPLVVGCDASTPFRCSDGTCAASQSQCKPVLPCANECELRCPGTLECVRSSNATECTASDATKAFASCPSSMSFCPASSPTLCPDGTCVESLQQCGNPYHNPATANECTAASPIRCFDGSCATSYFACVKKTADFLKAPEEPSLNINSYVSVNICPAALSVCPNGACVNDLLDCGPVPACPNDSIRCADGTCLDTTSNPSATCANVGVGVCPDNTMRCADGLCRVQCPQFNGCPLSAPYACLIKSVQCVANRAACHSAALHTTYVANVEVSEVPTWNFTALASTARKPFASTTRARALLRQAKLVREANEKIKMRKQQVQQQEQEMVSQALVNLTSTGTVATLEGPRPIASATAVNGGSSSSSLSVLEPSSSSSSAAAAAVASDEVSTLAAAGAVAGQEVCAVDCERDVPATAQVVMVYPSADYTIDISKSSTGVPRTRMFVPSGSFSSAVSLSIHSVSPIYFDGGFAARTNGYSNPYTFPPLPATEPTDATEASYWSQQRIDSSFTAGKTGDFASKILSTPFRCEVNALLETGLKPDRPLTISSYTDYATYTSSGGSGDTSAGVSCEFQFKWDSATYPPGAPDDSSACSGMTEITKTSMSVQMDACDSQMQFAGVFHSQQSIISWNGETSQQCLCYNFTSIGAAAAAARTNNGVEDAVGKTFCVFAERNGDMLTVGFPVGFPDSSSAATMATCPLDTSQRTVIATRVYTSTTADPCATSALSSNVIPKSDICLAYYSRYGTWKCIYNRDQRIAKPVWTSPMGINEVSSSLPACEEYAYAFAYIPLPAAPPPATPDDCFWCEYGRTIIIVVSCVGGAIVILIAVVCKFSRDRAKYKAAQEKLENLKTRHTEMVEFEGGLGVADADGEVNMTANPLVIQMREIQKQLDETNTRLDSKGKMEEQQIQQLNMDRQRLKAEIKRLEALRSQQDTEQLRPTRMDDAPTAVLKSQDSFRSSAAYPTLGGPGAGGPTLQLAPAAMSTPKLSRGSGSSSAALGLQTPSASPARASPTPASPVLPPNAPLLAQTSSVTSSTRNIAMARPLPKKRDDL